jgi:demethylmenaquinone methyltransferase/2-methoxy-6-polyprenyl-1,4-benzoquinol methylase
MAVERTPSPPHPVLRKYYARERDRQPFVTALFESAAQYYDRGCAVGSLGSGQAYRRSVLLRSGLRAGMKLLDVATGTGLVARGAAQIVGASGTVVGLDPSGAMLREARKAHTGLLVQGTVEDLPFGAGHFDFVSMGYALRHVADLRVALTECLRVLRPGGRLLVLEISQPSTAVGRWMARVYLERAVPLLTRLLTRSSQAELLMKYHWETIAECVPPAVILEVLAGSGFTDVERRVLGGVLSEYLGRKPGA